MDHLSISEVVRQVQKELVESEISRMNDGIPPLFELGSVDLEIGFEISKEGGGKGSIKIFPVELGIDGKYTKKASHSVKLHFSVPSRVSENEEPGVFPAEE